MLKYPSKLPILYLTTTLFFLLISSIIWAQGDLTALQEEARKYRDQGWQLQKKGDIDAAVSYYQKAVIVDPGYPVAYNDLGVIFEAKGWIERAEEMYLKAIEAAPDYPNSYSNLALLYEGQKDYGKAVTYWIKRAMLGGPSDPWAEAARRRLEDIARLTPEVYSRVGGEKGISLLEGTSASGGTQATDNKSRALNHLARAKESFAHSDYVAALKEATLAEYLDSSNKEISAFVEKVRRVILQ